MKSSVLQVASSSSFLGVILVSCAAMLTSCGGETEAAAPTESASAQESSINPREIEVKPDLRLKLEVGAPAWQNVSNTLSVTGRVEADQTRMTRVTAPVTGRIIDLNIVEGQHVEKGDIVATLYSTELASAQTAFLKSTTDRIQADRAVARARQLLEAGVISSAELQRREAEAQQTATEFASQRKQLDVLGMPEEAIQKLETTRTIDSMTHVLAAGEGRVLDRQVTQGQTVQAAQVLCVIADLSSVWLVADVPEENARALRIGKQVQAEIPALPGETMTGTLSWVSATVNPETRTILARMDLKNPDRHYKPAMLATMLMMDGAERHMVVPASAVVRDGADENVFVQIAPNKFLLTRVVLGSEVGNGRVVMDGLQPGAKIVTEGAFHLNNERRRLSARGDAAE